jgi:hypothetical protein
MNSFDWQLELIKIHKKIEDESYQLKIAIRQEEEEKQRRTLEGMVSFPRTPILKKLDSTAAKIIEKHDY